MSRVEFGHELLKREVRSLFLLLFIVIIFPEFGGLLGQIFLDLNVKLRLGFRHCLVEFLFALVGLVNSRLTSVLELFDVVSSRDHILATEFNCHLGPLPELVHGLRVRFEFLFVQVEVFLEEGHLLEISEFGCLWASEFVFCHLLVVGLVTDDFTDLLEGELVRVAVANLLSGVAKEVAHRLEHARELNHVVVSQVEHGLFPLLRGNRVVLFFLVGFAFFVGFVGATVFAAAKVLGGTLLVLLDETFVLGGTGRVIECGGEQLETMFLKLEGLGLLVEGLIFLLVDKLGLATLFKLLDILLFLVLLIDAILFRSVELAVDIRSEVLFLKLFPPVSVELDGAETKLPLLLRVLTVLSARVHADNILDLLLVVGCRLDR